MLDRMEREMLLAEIENMKREKGLGGKTSSSLVLAILDFRQ